MKLPPQMLSLSRSECPEVELLRCCARTQLNASIVDHINALLHQELNWATLVQLASQHGMMPLLYWNLNATCPQAVPAAVLHPLRQYFHTTAHRNLSRTHELLRLLKLFETQTIPVIPFKGPVLAASVYPNLALRQFSDLDIWVPNRAIDRAKALLTAEGYCLQKELGWEHPFTHSSNGIHIDLHEAIAPKFFALALDFDSVWAGTKPVIVANKTISSLSPEDLLQILCIQWGKDCCQERARLAQLCDVAEVLSVHPDLDWQLTLERSQTLGTERMLLLTLAMAKELLDITLPEPVLGRMLAHSTLELLSAEVQTWLWQKPQRTVEVEDDSFWSFLWVYRHRFYLQMRERLSDKVVYCRHWLQDCLYFALIPNAKDADLLPLPKVFSFLYYPLHLLRLIQKHGLSLINPPKPSSKDVPN